MQGGKFSLALSFWLLAIGKKYNKSLIVFGTGGKQKVKGQRLIACYL